MGGLSQKKGSAMDEKDFMHQYKEHSKTYKSHAEEYAKHYQKPHYKPYQESYHPESIKPKQTQWGVTEAKIYEKHGQSQ